ncbi:MULTISPECIES: CopG family transcriptional regulator [Thermodesulfovibrio]|uniref:ribbon-helix-helix domain-containing protein n=1 Tax=Thermodesulfovibrio TaxID=28261 RepID=UPI00262625FE|nr:CopG family transcriptional regulator [Thermodesulfovibrio sp.]
MKKQRKIRYLQVRLPEETLLKLKESAERRGISVSAFVRLLIINQLEREKKKGEFEL